MSLLVTSPVTGTVVGLDSVPDPAFSTMMVGPGTAVDPLRERGHVCAPVGGTLRKLKHHAFIVVTDEGYGVLVHLGIDTISLDGTGFASLAAEGDLVLAGQPIVAWDPGALAADGFSPICPVIALDATDAMLSQRTGARPVMAGDPLFTWDSSELIREPG
jgi:PTS system glucose-specific IIA component